ncbi:MAG: S1/P1 Nuclease [Chitinophagaceae bacterium]|nr:S1/P1 Nuclease [Sphingobacteriales bacterium]OJW05113.1 MAG: S1/P1 Nuclease [Sphingobacteriales bacterium 44-61]TXJ25960.1 MAG: S1/P1 Nuclease [Chitinophagaceae bacterium]
MKLLLPLFFLLTTFPAHSWGFFGHRKINYYAVFLLPPEMILLYKQHIAFIEEHAVDPDKRRYVVAAEGPRHYIDIDQYGQYPYPALPRSWKDAVARYSTDSLQAHGIIPWWLQTMLQRLTHAFKEKNQAAILKYSAEIGHYIGDAHVPLHASSNHNGQLTNQKGIHGFWESRIPELLAEQEWDFLVGKAVYISNPAAFFWKRILESAAAADTVLKLEKELSQTMQADQRFAFEERNGAVIRQYSSAYTRLYNKKLNGMVERRMRQSILATASCWYTAWVNAGQPDLQHLSNKEFSEAELKEFEILNAAWKNGEEHE